MLTVLPLGLLGSVVLFDLGALISGIGLFDRVVHLDMAAGLLAGFTALTFLLVDLTTALSGTAFQRALGIVSSATAGMLILFAVVWWVRQDGDPATNAGLFVLEVAALAVGGTGAWYARDLTGSARARVRRGQRLGLGDL